MINNHFLRFLEELRLTKREDLGVIADMLEEAEANAGDGSMVSDCLRKALEPPLYWMTRNGKRVAVRKMDSQHIVNILRQPPRSLTKKLKSAMLNELQRRGFASIQSYDFIAEFESQFIADTNINF